MSGYGLEEQMHDFRYDTDPARLEEREAATEGLSPIPIWPSLLQVSGLYEYRKPFAIPHPIPVPIPPTTGAWGGSGGLVRVATGGDPPRRGRALPADDG